MASYQTPILTTTTTFRWTPLRRRLRLRRRKQLPYIRLGAADDKKKLQGGDKPSLVKIIRRLKVRWWLKVKYLYMVQRMKQTYTKMIRDLVEAGKIIDAFQHKISMESTFALPITGISMSSYPSATGSVYRPSYMF